METSVANTQTGADCTVDTERAGNLQGLDWPCLRVDHHYTGRLVSDPCVALASPKHFQPRFIYRLISIAGLEGLLLSFSFSTGC